MGSDLEAVLGYRTARRENRMQAAQWVIERPECMPELLRFCFLHDKEISYKACWVLEFVCLENLALLYPLLNEFFAELPNVHLDSSVRPMANICEKICERYYKKFDPALREALSNEHKQIMTECCFDWLITQQKVACHVRAMTCLELLGTESHWIHSELIQILEREIHNGSAGYKSRAGKILRRLK